jgi:hypothetical protein
MHLKCLHGVFVVCGHEYSHRHVRRTDLLNYLEAVSPRHLYVEKQDIKAAFLQRSNHFLSVAALPGHLHLFLPGQQKPQPLPRQGLVIRNEGFDLHTPWHSYGMVMATSKPPVLSGCACIL